MKGRCLFMEKEIYKDIPGYEGLYQVSNLGNIKSLERVYYSGRNKAIRKVQKEIILKTRLDRDGYLVTGLSKDGIQSYCRVHRLVALVFIENDDPVNKTQVNHIDEDKTNNKVDNLEWCTHEYNINYGNRSDNASKTSKGIQNKGSIKAMEKIKRKVVCITTGKVFDSIKEAASFYNCNPSVLTKVCQGKRKSCGKLSDGTRLQWKYLENSEVTE